MAKNVDNQQKVEKQVKVEKKNNKSSSNVDTKKYKPMKKTSSGSIWIGTTNFYFFVKNLLY